MRTALSIARRELLAYVTTPVFYVVGFAFLLLQGTSFWAVVEVLSDPSAAAPYQAVLATHFGGSALSWAIALVVIATLSMRLCAEDQSSGMWESNLAAGATDGQLLAGKYVASLIVYLLLWALTALFPLLIAAFAPAGAAIDSGPVWASYLGVALIGAGLLAVGLAASAVARSQIAAAVATFAVGMLLVLAGDIRDLVAGDSGGGLSAALSAVDVRGLMTTLAGGELSWPPVALSVALVAVGFAVARAAVVFSRCDGSTRRRYGVGVALTATAAVLACALASARPGSVDVTEGQVNSLSPATIEVLATLAGRGPVKVVVVEPALSGFAPVYDQVDRVLRRMRTRLPSMTVRAVNPTSAPAQLAKLAAEFALPEQVVKEGGAVVFEFDDRRRAVDLTDIASFGRDSLGVGAVEALLAEQAFATALLALSEHRRTTVCATTGNGEQSLLRPAADDRDWTLVGRRLSRDGITVLELGAIAPSTLERCDVVVVAGPRQPLPADTALAIDRFVDGGGGLLVAATGLIGADGLPATGLEAVLAEHGIGLLAAVVIDPSAEIGVPLLWATVEGYAVHPITSAFVGKRSTVWPAPRAIRVSSSAVALAAGSAASWAEFDIDALMAGRPTAADSDGELRDRAVAVAADSGAGRVVVFGTAAVAERSLIERGLGFGDSFAVAAIGWLARRTVRVDVGDKRPEHMRLVLTASSRTLVFALGVGLLPAVFAIAGLLMGWWRRRDPTGSKGRA